MVQLCRSNSPLSPDPPAPSLIEADPREDSGTLRLLPAAGPSRPLARWRPLPPGFPQNRPYLHPGKAVHPVNGEVPPVKGRPRKLPHYANRGKTSSSGGELASARSCFSTVRTALGKLRITGLLAQFDVARSFPQFPRPLLLQPTILTSERGTRFGIRKPPNHVPPPHLPDDPEKLIDESGQMAMSRQHQLHCRHDLTCFRIPNKRDSPGLAQCQCETESSALWIVECQP